DAQAAKRREPVRVVVYAAAREGKPARVKTRGHPEQDAEAVRVEFTAPAVGRLRSRVREQSVADSGLYERARAARGLPPVADAPVRPAAAPQPDPNPPDTPGRPDAP